jgi:hypothetical protein
MSDDITDYTVPQQGSREAQSTRSAGRHLPLVAMDHRHERYRAANGDHIDEQ